ncbi:MAG: UvrD-helicase domain-containing protein [Terriglobia bacterium]|jgi:DNA helicase-2/ATP-dependent DNA helicase PcrA
MSNLLDQLNPQQRAAVEETEGPLLILAGAGSGKTRVIAYRVAYLIEARQVPPENILAVTFTNKAADQMKERVGKLLAGQLKLRPGAPHVSTFHSFCVSVLRRHIERLGYSRDFTIYDDDDQLRVLKACIQELGLSEQITSPRSTLAKISYAKNRGHSPEELYSQAASPEMEKLASLYERYESKLRRANALDFDDLLLKTVDLLYNSSQVCEMYNQHFRYIQVDEYQDTNRIQYQLIRQLTLLQQNLCVVGDEDQSIYRWRGADIENILNFEKDYPRAKVIRLEQNYRSTQVILDAAGAVVSRNLARIGKTLRTDRSSGEKLRLFEARSADEEAEFVAGEVARTVAEPGDGSVAVLYRTNAQSRVLEEGLRRRGISYRLVGGFSFYARAEIKDALAYARLANNLSDDAAFGRIVNTPPRGIGDTTLGALAESARQSRLSLWEALEHELFQKRLPARARSALEGFHALVKELVGDRQSLLLGEFFKRILERTRYLQLLKQENQPASEDRIENLQELVNAATEAEEQGVTLAEFLDHAALVSDADDYDEHSRVTLMTLHSAKGLEFETVFLVGMEEGLFPHQFSLDDPAGIEEERRLCYVGMTRAKDRLTLSWARQRRSFARESYEETKSSRFLREIPGELLEPFSSAGLGWKPRTSWDNAVNSVSSVERFLERRGMHGAPAASRARSPAGLRWRIGSKVRHAKFGVGTILGAEGEGEDTKLTVSFPDYGQKKFMAEYATLEKA